MATEDVTSLRIVHLFKDADPPLRAGITTYLKGLSSRQAAAGHEVTLHCAGPSGPETVEGVRVIRHGELGRFASTPISPGLAAAAFRSASQADIVHHHSPCPPTEAGLILRGHRWGASPQVMMVHGDIKVHPRLDWLAVGTMKRLAKQVDALVFASEPLAQLMGQQGVVNPNQFTIPFPVDLRPAVHEGFNHDGPLRLIFVGRLVPYKGLEVLVEAMSNHTDTELSIIGEGPSAPSLRQQVAQLGLENRVRFLGGLDDDARDKEIAASDVFMLPSISSAETWGIAMAEAMGQGLPAISTEVGTGTSWLNLNDVTGLVVDPGQPAALTAAIDVMRNVEVRTSMGKRARERIEEIGGWDQHCASVDDVYAAARRGPSVESP